MRGCYLVRAGITASTGKEIQADGDAYILGLAHIHRRMWGGLWSGTEAEKVGNMTFPACLVADAFHRVMDRNGADKRKHSYLTT